MKKRATTRKYDNEGRECCKSGTKPWTQIKVLKPSKVLRRFWLPHRLSIEMSQHTLTEFTFACRRKRYFGRFLDSQSGLKQHAEFKILWILPKTFLDSCPVAVNRLQAFIQDVAVTLHSSSIPYRWSVTRR